MSIRGRISSTASAGSSSATCGGLFTGNQSVARIVVRNALSTSASRRPLRPRPMMPILRPVQVARRAADEFALLLRTEERRQASQHAGEQCHRVVGHLVGQHARGAGDDDVRLDDRRHEAMVEPGGGRLNPPQPASAHDFVPRHGHLRVAAKHVGRRQLLGHAFLAGVDHLNVRRDGRNLGDVPASTG